MDTGKILSRSWDLVWKYRALWVFGIILAFTTSSGFVWLGTLDRDNVPWETVIKVSPTTTIYLPGEGLVLDFTDTEGVTIYLEDADDLQAFWTELELWDDIIPPEIWTVIIVGAAWLALLILLSMVGRYTSRAALIGMVDSSEQTGEQPGFWKGLRMGFSRNAWRLFFIDLIVFLGWLLVIVLMVSLVGAPLFLLAADSELGRAIGIATSGGMFFVFLAVGVVLSAFVSLFVQVIRRACVQDNLGVFAGIRRGWKTIFSNFTSFLLIWAIWIGVRIGWILALIPIVLLLTPVFLVMTLLGVFIAAAPALITAGITSLLVEGLWPWIAAGLVGVPIFFLMVGLPLAFISGFVEIFKSNLWTLSYRDLSPLQAELKGEKPDPVERDQDLPVRDAEAPVM
jgi:hypothetical protein